MALVAAPAALGATGDISTVAGNGSLGSGGDGGPALSASFLAPAGIAFSGGDLHITDFYGHTVRKVDSSGTITRVAGTGIAGYSGDGGPATAARLNEPADAAVDSAGNLYVADFLNSRVRKIAPDGTISSYAGTGSYGYSGDGGPAMSARLGNPAGLDVDGAGNLYVADLNSTVRKITPSGFISTVAGTGTAGYSGDGGPATAARINQAGDVAVDGVGNVYIGEWEGHRVRRVTPAGMISTVAGTGSSGYTGNGGPATAARMTNPGGVDVDSSGTLFVAEFGNNVVRKVVSAGTISLAAGTGTAGFSGDGGPATSAQLYGPSRVALAPSGDFYISDWSNRRIRKVQGLGRPDAPVITGTSPPSPSSDLKPTVLGTAQAGSTVKLYTNSTCTSAVIGTGSAEEFADKGIKVGTLPSDATTSFWATATDASGAVSGCSTTTLTYVTDSSPPSVPTIDSAPASPGNDMTPTWTFSGNGSSDSYECRLVRGATVISEWSSCAAAATYDLSSEPDGAYTFLVRARDSAGNGGMAASASYELDTAAPAAPSIGSAPPSPGSASSPSWSFSAESGATLECRLSRGATVVSDWAACSGSKAYDLAAEADGAYTFSVRARDAAGNTGADATSGYVLDRTAPAAPSIGSAPASPSADDTPQWSFSAEPGAGLECRLVQGATVISDWAVCSDPKSYDLSSRSDGAYTFSVRARDAAGNTGPAASSSFELDRTAPAAPSIDAAPASPGSDTGPAWSFSGEPGAAFECRLTRGATVVSGWAACSDPRSYDLSTEPDGTYAFQVRAIDAAGNTGPDSASSYQLDTTAPAAPTVDSGPSSPGNDPSPSWSFSGEAGAALECRLERAGTVVYDWAACSAARTYELTLQPDGAYRFYVRATDAAGNGGGAASSDYTLDRTAPAPPVLGSSPPSPGNDTSPDWSFSGEAGVSFECRLARGATVVFDWAACSDPHSYDLSAEPDGAYTFSVRAVDGAGNSGTPASSTYVLDTAAAAPPSIDSAPSSPGRDTTPAWSFSSTETGVTFECRLDRGATTVDGWGACTDPKTYDLSGEPDGTYAFSVRTRDGAGNVGPAASGSYALDTTPPAAPSIDSAPSSPGRDDTPAWSFSGEAGASFECRLERGVTVVSDWSPCPGSKGYDLAGEPDGSYSFSVRAVDAAGNASPAASSPYALDRAAPAAPSIDAAPATPGNDATPRWSFSGEPGASFECRLARGATVVSDWAACSDPKGYDLSSNPDGTYSFSVRARDAAGNTGTASSSSYALDTTPPPVPTIDSAPATPGNDTTPTWSFSGPGASFECRVERGATVVSDWSSCSGSHVADLASQPDGGYTFRVRATDTAGNTGPAASASYALDTAAPAAPSIDSAPSSPASGTSPNWSFSGESGAAFECRLERGASVISDWSSCTSPRAFDLSSQADGTYTFRVRASDGAGNTSAAASSSYVLDRSAPAAPSIDSAPASPGADTTPAWSFSGEAGAAFECRLTRGATVISDWAGCSNPKSYDLSSEPDGTYSFAVRATDGAGNRGPAAATSYVLDGTAPAAPSIDSAPSSPGRDSSPSWGFSGEAGAAFECRLERGATVVSDWSSCPGTQGYDLSGEPDGDYRFSVRATDAVGNTGPASSSSYELDTAPPAAPTIDAAPPTPSNDPTPSWDFSGPGGASLECRLERGATVVSDWAACSSPRAYDLSSEPDGSYTFRVRARDAAGNTSAPADSGYDLDSTIPAVPTIDSGPGEVGNDGTPSWSFSGDPGVSFDCRIERGGTTVAGWAPCTSPSSFDLSGEPDGGYTFSVRARNGAGTASAPATADYQLDRAGPGAPSIDSAPASPGSSSSPSWSFSGEAGAAFECRLERGATLVSDWSGCTSPRSFDLSGEPDGDYTFRVRAADGAGNTGAASSSDLTLDRAAPAAPSIDSAPTSPGTLSTPAWAFSAEPGATVECRLTRGATVVSGWAACASPRSFDLGGEPDGSYGFEARARDAAGNQGPAASSGYVLDTTGAAVQIDTGPGPVGNGRSPEWAFSSEAGAGFECRLTRGTATVADWAPCSSPKSFDLSGEPDGDYAFAVRATDQQSNQGAPVSAGYRLDTLAPAAPSIDSGPASRSRDRSPAWAFSGEAGAAFECRVDGAGGLVSDWGSCASPSVFDLSGRGDGRYTLNVRATDAAGNTGPDGSGGFELDTTPPGAPVFSEEPKGKGRDPAPRWAFGAEGGATLECRVSRDGRALGDWQPCASPKALDLSSDPDGNYALAVRATDEAGNVGSSADSSYELQRSVAERTEDAVQPDRRQPSGLPGAPAAPPAGPREATPAPSGAGGGEPPASVPQPGPREGGAGGGSAGLAPDALAHELAPGAGIPEKAGPKVLKSLGRAARAVLRHAASADAAFPGALLALVMCFFAVQNRIDRNDPKLGLAPVFADPDLEFLPHDHES